MTDRLFHLMERHQRLDAELTHLRARRWPDPLALLRLKERKLAVKDRIAALMSQPARSR